MALASPLERLHEEAICSICLEYMSDPVSVDCGHNFCRDCIAKHCQEKGLWADRPFLCPQCRATCHRSNFRPNRQLANIVESIRQLGLPAGPAAGTLLCAAHDERLKLFCEEDEEAICVVCRESLQHRPHTVYPIEEAAQVYKAKLQKSLENLSKEVEQVKKCESAERMKTQECKEAVKKKRERIVSEFGKLHRLLADEEKLLLQKLEEEENRILLKISENLALLVEQKSALDELILEIREKFQQPADGLLKDMKSILNRCESMKFQAPKAVSVTLRENYSIPERCLGMRDMLKKFKVDVTLDPDTAHPELTLSEDRKSVKRGGKKLILSLFDNPKRFNATPLVLGVQAFFSGRCYWEVQVGDKPEWGLGLCRDSASRKGIILFSPSNGYWVLRLQVNGNYEALTSPVSILNLSVRPRCIGIFLDYEAGEISFYNVTDRSHIYTFTDKFSGNLRPLFFPGALMGGKNAEPLVISWMRDTQGSGCIIL
ncbi:PREDICTED: E3 ubiquitin-protein ligase TRIM39-like isoform X1 [Tinamus guttatus]|uniref:E3 ubiquitin-protein ligase TRIM39-like isoform X1 n=1 Tax=Tinamus guttatus TaxID=94827 RepID=UPI00052F1708|nr:PREDICTED: E3 ubiquitin-protein ligase TRIM39-like isoform X1 [Tinamus guttatus]